MARSTSAAPTYFPPAIIKNLATGEKWLILMEGFLPTIQACALMPKHVTQYFNNASFPSAKNMLILSIGTGGQFKLPDISKSKKWGLLNWAKSIPDIMMDGSLDTVNYQIKKIFETLEGEHQFNYKRVDVPLHNRKDYAEDMADASPENIKNLQKTAELALSEALKDKKDELALDKFIELLLKNQPKK